MDKPELRKVLRDIIDECQVTDQPIRINCLTRGYRVDIGCASFAFERLESMIEAVNLFLDDRADAETAFNEHMAELLGVNAAPPQVENADCEVAQGTPEPPILNRGDLAEVRDNAVRVGYPEGTEDEDTPG